LLIRAVGRFEDKIVFETQPITVSDFRVVRWWKLMLSWLMTHLRHQSLDQKTTSRRCQTRFDLYHGDCVEGMALFSPESVDLVVTSPPYNLGVKYTNYKDDQHREAHLAWCLQWAEEIRRVLKTDGSFFLNVGGSPSNPLFPHEVVGAFTQELFKLQNTIHWIKAITIETDEGEIISKGHFKPISSNRYLNDCHEYIFHFTKTGETRIDRLALGVPYADKTNITRWKHTNGKDRRCRGNTWFIPYKTIRDRSQERPHPATFPVELAENCILLHGRAAETVMLDPFVGIGNSAVAAKNIGVRQFIGFEIDEEYLRKASNRINSPIMKSFEQPDKILK
jgi:site-specific DNA-methyltransferase (adenine-specific)